ncbi:MAG TPA: SGNH/GDSL hydrolase family protein [Candidatus Krumholzibacteria bacterium]|nr:SGNH/GDSL hydrolase family protein [Candidatus Krumholzibacteria bacterium]
MTSRLAAKTLVAVLATIVALAACEIVLRIVWRNPYRHESPDHLLKLRMHHPRTDHTYSRALLDEDEALVRLRTDARSYILPSFQHRNPDATVTFLGGSTTECSAVSEDVRFPALVSTLLAAEGLEVNTLNAARAGNNVHDSVNVLLNHVVVDRPQIAVLMHASNDVGVLRHAGNYGSSMGAPVSLKHLLKWSAQIASSRCYLAGLLRQGAGRGSLRPRDPATDWRQSEPPADSATVRMYRQRLTAFVRMCRAFDIVPVLTTEPYSRHRTTLTPGWLEETSQDQFNDVIREVGGTEGALVVDLETFLHEQVPDWDEPNKIFYDAIHVTEEGSRVYARHIVERLRPVILGLRPAAEK